MKLEIIHEAATGKTHPMPLLFVHGKWHGAWCWQENFMPYFAEHGYECFALSLRGHGNSDGHDRIGWHTIADYVSDMEQVAGQIESPPVIIGHSMGGFITQKYLEKHTAPAAVLLAALPYYGILPSTLMTLRKHPLIVMKSLFTWSMYPAVETPALTREHLFGADMPEEKVTEYFKRLQEESFRAYLDELILNLVQPKRVKTPMLILGATKDTVISGKAVNDTARAYGTKAEFFSMAHDMMLESGWKAVADRIMNWLKEKQL
jgi:pimeloyl-ACP methyl ester carboxylesterase